MSSAVSFLNILQPVFMLGGAVITLVSLAMGSKRESYAAKLLSIDSGGALIAAGLLCSVVVSDDLSHRLLDGFIVFMLLIAIALPQRVQKELAKPDSKLTANETLSTRIP